MENNASKNQIVYSKIEERINIISHLVGASLALIGSIFLIARVAMRVYEGGHYDYPALAVVAVSLYSLSLIFLYLMSTLYHFQPFGHTSRAVFRRFDHCSISFLIAGTYAPYLLVGLANNGTENLIWGIVIASVIVLTAVLNITFNAINVHKFRYFSMSAFIAMGWACIIVINRLVQSISLTGFLYLLIGGLFYTVGLVFYKIKKIKCNHAIWHFFVMIGSILHFVSIYFYVV